MAAPSWEPSRLKIVLSMSRVKPSAGAMSKASSQRVSGRKQRSMQPWEKRAKKRRIASLAGKRTMPSKAWRAESKRSQSQ